MNRRTRKPSRDRIIPGCRDGTYAPENVMIVCAPCNADRGRWTLAGFAAALEAEGDQRAKHVRRCMTAHGMKRATNASRD
jgi:hypothetical protein